MPAMKKNSECTHMGNIFNKLVKQIGNPIDFELPDGFYKWKPLPYTFIKRNLTKKIKRRLKDDGYFVPAVHHQDHLVCAVGIATVACFSLAARQVVNVGVDASTNHFSTDL